MRYATEHGHYELNPFPGSNQIVVSSHAFVHPEFRSNGVGTQLSRERVEKAKELDYDYMVATVRADNAAQLAIMRKVGWKYLDSFHNHVTDVVVHLYGMRLGKKVPSVILSTAKG